VGAFFELRDYRIKDGKRDRWAKWMEDEVIPFQIERGMTIIGSWVDRDQPDRYVWMRRFESDEHHAALGKAVYEDPLWASEFRPKIDEMLDRPRGLARRSLRRVELDHECAQATRAVLRQRHRSRRCRILR
jgi:hypothetical protein